MSAASYVEVVDCNDNSVDPHKKTKKILSVLRAAVCFGALLSLAWCTFWFGFIIGSVKLKPCYDVYCPYLCGTTILAAVLSLLIVYLSSCVIKSTNWRGDPQQNEFWVTQGSASLTIIFVWNGCSLLYVPFEALAIYFLEQKYDWKSTVFLLSWTLQIVIGRAYYMALEKFVKSLTQNP